MGVRPGQLIGKPVDRIRASVNWMSAWCRAIDWGKDSSVVSSLLLDRALGVW